MKKKHLISVKLKGSLHQENQNTADVRNVDSQAEEHWNLLHPLLCPVLLFFFSAETTASETQTSSIKY